LSHDTPHTGVVQYVRHRPSQPLACHVAYLWAVSDSPAHRTERFVPSGAHELVVNLNEDALQTYQPGDPVWRRHSGTVASGAQRRYFVVDPRAHASMVGIHFRPGGASPFLGVPPGELTDRHVDLENLWGRSAIELRERLCAAATAADRFAILEDALQSNLSRTRRSHPAVPLAVEQLARPGITVGEVAARLDLSRRRLIEVFTAAVGLTPKRLSRVLRFQRVSAMARRTRSPDWAQLAHTCGYYDQSHLIGDVQEFTGASPGQMLRSSQRVMDHHLALPEEVKFFQDPPLVQP
jgi:AraC-like DNA-binding protein